MSLWHWLFSSLALPLLRESPLYKVFAFVWRQVLFMGFVSCLIWQKLFFIFLFSFADGFGDYAGASTPSYPLRPVFKCEYWFSQNSARVENINQLSFADLAQQMSRGMLLGLNQEDVFRIYLKTRFGDEKSSLGGSSLERVYDVLKVYPELNKIPLREFQIQKSNALGGVREPQQSILKSASGHESKRQGSFLNLQHEQIEAELKGIRKSLLDFKAQRMAVLLDPLSYKKFWEPFLQHPKFMQSKPSLNELLMSKDADSFQESLLGGFFVEGGLPAKSKKIKRVMEYLWNEALNLKPQDGLNEKHLLQLKGFVIDLIWVDILQDHSIQMHLKKNQGESTLKAIRELVTRLDRYGSQQFKLNLSYAELAKWIGAPRLNFFGTNAPLNEWVNGLEDRFHAATMKKDSPGEQLNLNRPSLVQDSPAVKGAPTHTAELRENNLFGDKKLLPDAENLDEFNVVKEGGLERLTEGDFLYRLRPLSLIEAPFRSCLGAGDCGTRTYFEFALYPHVFYFTLTDVSGNSRGFMQIVLGHLAGGERLAFLDKLQNWPQELIEVSLTGVNLALTEIGYPLHVPLDVGGEAGLSNDPSIRRAFLELLAGNQDAVVESRHIVDGFKPAQSAFRFDYQHSRSIYNLPLMAWSKWLENKGTQVKPGPNYELVKGPVYLPHNAPEHLSVDTFHQQLMGLLKTGQEQDVVRFIDAFTLAKDLARYGHLPFDRYMEELKGLAFNKNYAFSIRKKAWLTLFLLTRVYDLSSLTLTGKNKHTEQGFSFAEQRALWSELLQWSGSKDELKSNRVKTLIELQLWPQGEKLSFHQFLALVDLNLAREHFLFSLSSVRGLEEEPEPKGVLTGGSNEALAFKKPLALSGWFELYKTPGFFNGVQPTFISRFDFEVKTKNLLTRAHDTTVRIQALVSDRMLRLKNLDLGYPIVRDHTWSLLQPDLNKAIIRALLEPSGVQQKNFLLSESLLVKKGETYNLTSEFWQLMVHQENFRQRVLAPQELNKENLTLLLRQVFLFEAYNLARAYYKLEVMDLIQFAFYIAGNRQLDLNVRLQGFYLLFMLDPLYRYARDLRLDFLRQAEPAFLSELYGRWGQESGTFLETAGMKRAFLKSLSLKHEAFLLTKSRPYLDLLVSDKTQAMRFLIHPMTFSKEVLSRLNMAAPTAHLDVTKANLEDLLLILVLSPLPQGTVREFLKKIILSDKLNYDNRALALKMFLLKFSGFSFELQKSIKWQDAEVQRFKQECEELNLKLAPNREKTDLIQLALLQKLFSSYDESKFKY